MLLPPEDQTLRIFDVPWSDTQRSFDTAKECEEARAKVAVPPEPAVAAAIKRLLANQPQSSPTAQQSTKPVERDFYCIATDDPRLRSGFKSE